MAHPPSGQIISSRSTAIARSGVLRRTVCPIQTSGSRGTSRSLPDGLLSSSCRPGSILIPCNYPMDRPRWFRTLACRSPCRSGSAGHWKGGVRADYERPAYPTHTGLESLRSMPKPLETSAKLHGVSVSREILSIEHLDKKSRDDLQVRALPMHCCKITIARRRRPELAQP